MEIRNVRVTAPAAADTLAVVPVALQGESAPEGGRYILFGDVQIDSLRRTTQIDLETASAEVGRKHAGCLSKPAVHSLS